ncbi:MAG: hypothetical protein O6945_09275 [Gammaproteobacteria bacterium]|nr:hypothetical protein [Gammaproteobacteria bacterium]
MGEDRKAITGIRQSERRHGGTAKRRQERRKTKRRTIVDVTDSYFERRRGL